MHTLAIKHLTPFFVLCLILFSYLMPASATVLSIRANTVNYAGEVTDSESDLQYLKARYYAPRFDRFITMDTFDLMNHYRYADGNPISNIDPSGHTIEQALGTLGIGAGFGGFSFAVFRLLKKLPRRIPWTQVRRLRQLDTLTVVTGLVGIISGIIALSLSNEEDQRKASIVSAVTGVFSFALNLVGQCYRRQLLLADIVEMGPPQQVQSVEIEMFPRYISSHQSATKEFMAASRLKARQEPGADPFPDDDL